MILLLCVCVCMLFRNDQGYWAYCLRQARSIRRRRAKEKAKEKEKARYDKAMDSLNKINDNYSKSLYDQLNEQIKIVQESKAYDNLDNKDDDEGTVRDITVNELVTDKEFDHQQGKIVGTWYPTMYAQSMLSFCESTLVDGSVLLFNWPTVDMASQVLKSIIASNAEIVIHIGPIVAENKKTREKKMSKEVTFSDTDKDSDGDNELDDENFQEHEQYLDVVQMLIGKEFPWDKEEDIVKRKKLRQRYRSDVERLDKQSWNCIGAMKLPLWPGFTKSVDYVFILSRGIDTIVIV